MSPLGLWELGWLWAVEEVGDFGQERWEVVLDDVPECAVGYVDILVGYSVSEADDCLIAGDLLGDCLIVVGESSGGFADDFELAFDCGAYQLVLFSLFEGDFGDGIEYEFRRLSDVP